MNCSISTHVHGTAVMFSMHDDFTCILTLFFSLLTAGSLVKKSSPSSFGLQGFLCPSPAHEPGLELAPLACSHQSCARCCCVQLETRDVSIVAGRAALPWFTWLAFLHVACMLHYLHYLLSSTKSCFDLEVACSEIFRLVEGALVCAGGYCCDGSHVKQHNLPACCTLPEYPQALPCMWKAGAGIP